MHLRAYVKTSSKPSRSYVDDLRGKSVEDLPAKVVSFGSPGLGEAQGYLPRNISNQNFVAADGSIKSCPFAQPLLPFQYYCQTSHNQDGFPPTSSTVIHGGLAKDMPQDLVLPVNRTQAIMGLAKFQVERMCNDSGRASDFNPTDFPRDMDAKKANPSMHSDNNNNHKALINTSSACFSDQYVKKEPQYCDVPTGKELVLYAGGGSQSKLTSTENWIYDQKHTLTTRESIQEGSNSCQPPTVTVVDPGFNSRKRAATQSTITDRLRKARINESLSSLRELVPESGKGNKEAAMEDIIDYVKYLQLQVKALSQSRLGGEATDTPFIYLEGFGHYLLHQQMLNEPLEVIVGQMMELDMPAVTQLLESKGLYVMPMSLAAGLPRNI